MSYPDLSAHLPGQGENANTDYKSREAYDELDKKRSCRLESIASWLAGNSPTHTSGNPPVSEDFSKEAAGVTLVVDFVEDEGTSTLEQIRRRQAGQQSDAGSELYCNGDLFRGRPLLTLKKKGDQKS